MANYKLLGQFNHPVTANAADNHPLSQDFEADNDADALIKGKELWDTVKADFPTARFVEIVKPIDYIQF